MQVKAKWFRSCTTSVMRVSIIRDASKRPYESYLDNATLFWQNGWFFVYRCF